MHRTSLCLRRFDLARSWQQHHPTLLQRTKRHHRACETVRAYSAAAKNKDKEELLRGVSVESREDVARILEQAQKADATWSTVLTDFYTPPVISDATAVIKKLTGVTCKAWGGYAQAERARLIVTKAEMIDAEDNQPLSVNCSGCSAAQTSAVSAVLVKGNFMFDSATHRDFLGAMLHQCGIERSKVGDIIVQGEQGAQILLVPELVPHLEMELKRVRTVPVTTTHLELNKLAVKEVKVVKMRTTFEASLRLDAIASAGFRTSRSKIVSMIKAGDVRLNWKETKASTIVASGDIISCAGKGRVEVIDAELTKKDRYAVQLERWV